MISLTSLSSLLQYKFEESQTTNKSDLKKREPKASSRLKTFFFVEFMISNQVRFQASIYFRLGIRGMIISKTEEVKCNPCFHLLRQIQLPNSSYINNNSTSNSPPDPNWMLEPDMVAQNIMFLCFFAVTILKNQNRSTSVHPLMDYQKFYSICCRIYAWDDEEGLKMKGHRKRKRQ